MAGVIYCGFARVAVHVLAQRHSLPNGNLSPNWKESVIGEYNSKFRGYPSMCFPSENQKYISEKISDIQACFKHRWNPSEGKTEYLKTFSNDAWNSLSMSLKQAHSLNSCKACDCSYSLEMATFPVRSRAIKRKNPVTKVMEEPIKKIKLSLQQTPTSTKKVLGRRILKELNPICNQSVGADLTQVLAATPEASVQTRKTSQERKRERRKQLTKVKTNLETHFADQDSRIVYGDRLSYRKYNEVCLAESYES